MEWPIVKLGDISELITKGTTPTSVGFKFTDTGINFIKVESITTSGTFLPSKFAAISEDCNEALKRSQLKVGDVLFSIAGALGRTALVTQDILPANTNQALAIIRLKSDLQIDKRFLMLALTTGLTLEQVDKHKGGVAQQNLSLAQLKTFEIPLPPIQEQKRIVAILDQAFADIDKARALTEQNLKNGRELFESYLQQVFSLRGEGWSEKDLAEVATISMGQSPKGSSYNSEEIGTPLINGPVEFGPDAFSKTIRSKYTTKPTKMCKAGDLILCVRGSTTGRMNIAGFDACIGRGVAAISSRQYQGWINHFVNFKREVIYKLGSGATFPNVSAKMLAKFRVVVPPSEIMDDVISEIETFKAQIEGVIGIYEQKLSLLASLKTSLLQKAFSGDLTKDKQEAA